MRSACTHGFSRCSLLPARSPCRSLKHKKVQSGIDLLQLGLEQEADGKQRGDATQAIDDLIVSDQMAYDAGGATLM